MRSGVGAAWACLELRFLLDFRWLVRFDGDVEGEDESVCRACAGVAAAKANANATEAATRIRFMKIVIVILTLRPSELPPGRHPRPQSDYRPFEIRLKQCRGTKNLSGNALISFEAAGSMAQPKGH